MANSFIHGWNRDVKDIRDANFAFAAAPSVLKALPPKTDLRAQCPPVLNQGNLGSCTANAAGNLDYFMQRKQKLTETFLASRLFVYYNARFIEGTDQEDSGAQLRDVLKTIGKQGVCPESEWPYDVSKFALRPPTSCYKHARKHVPVSYHSIPQIVSQMKSCLAMGKPFIFGFMVYETFDSAEVAQSGVINMPQPGEQMLGGHAVMAVGYDDTSKRFLVMNSWGTSWGMKGFFTIPYNYLKDTHLAADFWTIDITQ
jgi:C1A family cysteine protease